MRGVSSCEAYGPLEIAMVTVLVNEPAKTLAGTVTATVALTLIVPRPAPAGVEALKYLTGAPEAPGSPRFVFATSLTGSRQVEPVPHVGVTLVIVEAFAAKL